MENNINLVDAVWCKVLWGFYPPGYEDLEKNMEDNSMKPIKIELTKDVLLKSFKDVQEQDKKTMKEIYTDLEKPGVGHTSFNLKSDKDWVTTFDMLDTQLTIGVDIEFVGEPTREGDNMIYKIKAISDKAKKMFIAE